MKYLGIDGTQKSKVWVHSLFSPKKNMVRPPGFEPGSAPWKGAILNQARLWPHSSKGDCQWLRFKSIDRVDQQAGQWKARIIMYEPLTPVYFEQVSGRLRSYKNPYRYSEGENSLIVTRSEV